MKLLKNFYLKYIETKLSNKITFVIGVILVIQVVMFFVMYSYSYHIRREEIVENNIQILHQVNTNYLAGIIEDIDTASMEIFFNKVFWKKNEQSPVNEDDQIYNILASQYHSDNDLNSIYLYSSASNKFYIMDEASFNQIPVKSSASTLYIFNGDDLQKMPWYEAAQEKFSDSFLSKKYLITYIIMRYNNAADPVAYCRQIEQALKQLTPAQTTEIMEARKIGLKSREQVVVELLEQYLG